MAKRVLSMRNAAINKVRAAFVVSNIDSATATTDLGNLGVPSAAIGQFLTAWTIEQQTNVKRLSAAQVGALAKDGIITAANAVTRWVAMGYAPDEASLLLYIYQPAAGNATTGIISFDPATLPADGASTSTVTVQVYDSTGMLATSSQGAVALTASLGTVGPVTDNNNGTYNATYTAGSVAGSDSIQGTINGQALESPAPLVLTTVTTPASS